MVSTFPVWATIVIFGVVALFFMGCINIYVPKGQREKAKAAKFDMSDEESTVFYEYRLSGSWYFLMPSLVASSASVMFFIEDFKPFRDSLVGGGAAGTALAIIVFIAVFFVVEGMLMVAPFLGELVSFREIEKYYRVHYDVKIVDKETYFKAPKA